MADNFDYRQHMERMRGIMRPQPEKPERNLVADLMKKAHQLRPGGATGKRW